MALVQMIEGHRIAECPGGEHRTDAKDIGEREAPPIAAAMAAGFARETPVEVAGDESMGRVVLIEIRIEEQNVGGMIGFAGEAPDTDMDISAIDGQRNLGVREFEKPFVMQGSIFDTHPLAFRGFDGGLPVVAAERRGDNGMEAGCRRVMGIGAREIAEPAGIRREELWNEERDFGCDIQDAFFSGMSFGHDGLLPSLTVWWMRKGIVNVPSPYTTAV